MWSFPTIQSDPLDFPPGDLSGKGGVLQVF